MKRESWWPIGLAAALGLTVAGNALVIWKATRGDGAGVLPDYYRHAVAWDSAEAGRARSAALGWSADARLAAPAGGFANFELTLRSRAGVSIRGARVRLESFALARTAASRGAVVLEEHDGRYVGRVGATRAEWYEVAVVAIAGRDRYVATLRCLPGQGCRPA